MKRRNICGGTCSQPPELPAELTVNKLLWWGFRSQRGYIFAVMLAGTGGTLMSAIIPFLVGKAVDRGIRMESPGELAKWLGIMGACTLLHAVIWITRHMLALGI